MPKLKERANLPFGAARVGRTGGGLMRGLSARFVRHPKKEEWGVGEVIAVKGENLRVNFQNAGLRTIRASFIEAVEVPSDYFASSSIYTPRALDLERITDLCNQFIRDMKDNRKHYNDAGVAEAILREVQNRGTLTKTTARRLAAWCHTDGSVFQAGVETAQNISIAIYGRILSEEEF